MTATLGVPSVAPMPCPSWCDLASTGHGFDSERKEDGAPVRSHAMDIGRTSVFIEEVLTDEGVVRSAPAIWAEVTMREQLNGLTPDEADSFARELMQAAVAARAQALNPSGGI